MEVLNEHYQDTFAGIQQYLRTRDTFFFLILATAGIMLFQMASPQEAGVALSQFISKKLEIEQRIDMSFVSTMIWFAMLALTIRYFQTVVHVERQYDYIARLEDYLSGHFDKKLFTREGKTYLGKYPWFSNWAWGLYAIVFPTLLVILTSGKLWTEYGGVACPPPLWFLADCIIWVGIVVSTVLYMIMLHLGK